MNASLENKRTRCLNCDTELQGRYCHVCGQEDRDINLTFAALLHEFLGDFFTFDSRFVRTIVPLIFKPGFLTREFCRGRRAPYVPPLRLYLFISFILALLLSLIDINQSTHMEQLDSLEKIKEIRTTVIEYLQKKNAPEIVVNITGKALENLVQIAKNPGSFMDLLTSRLIYLMFFLLPIFALLLWLHFPTSHFNYLQFVVFALYYHAFASLLNFVFILVNTFLQWPVGWFVLLIVYIYTAVSMRTALNSSITGCLLKPFTLIGSYLIVLNFGLFVFMLLNILSFH